jgi:hypothetical protein
MRNRIVSAVAAAGLLGLIGGTVAANAGTDITSPETITTVGTTVKDKSIDVGRQGPSVGDTFATTVDIKSTTGVDLGTERTQCTLGTGRVAICTGAFDHWPGRDRRHGHGELRVRKSGLRRADHGRDGRLRERPRCGARSPDGERRDGHA